MGKRGKLPKHDLPVAPSCIETKPTKEQVDRERRYRAEDALRALQRAAEVKQDSGLMKDVKNLAKEQMNSLKKIQ